MVHPRVVTVPERGHEVEAHEEIVEVMDGVMEPVPRGVFVALLVELALEVELRPHLHRAHHALAPFFLRVYGEGAHPFPGVQVPAASEAAPPAILVPSLLEPLEGAADLGMVCVPEPDEGACHVPRGAQVAPLRSAHR